MKPLRMSQLLPQLINYSFFDWEDFIKDNDEAHRTLIGMPNNLLEVNHYGGFYNTNGFDDVQNLNRSKPISPTEWLKLEGAYINWLKQISGFIFGNVPLIVTPDFWDVWYPQGYPVNYEEKTLWQKPDNDKYFELLSTSGVIYLDMVFNSDLPGAIVETFEEFEILLKMCSRNYKLLFFSSNDRVIRFTEYLTILIEFKNNESKKNALDYLDASIYQKFW